MLCFHFGLSEMAGRSFYIIRNSLIFCIIVSKEGDDIVLYLKREDSTLEEDFFVRTKQFAAFGSKGTAWYIQIACYVNCAGEVSGYTIRT